MLYVSLLSPNAITGLEYFLVKGRKKGRNEGRRADRYNHDMIKESKIIEMSGKHVVSCCSWIKGLLYLSRV